MNFPHFSERFIVHDDGAILVIDKPPFVPSQAADPARPDDVLTRLRRFFGGAPYLGLHQRLDKDTSGLMALARTPGANKILSAELEGRRAIKRYLAAVSGWRRGEVTLRNKLAEARGGAMEVSARGKEAVTHVRVRERRGERALLELVLETGRTHQARVQLAHAGAPIAGDALYGGPRAPRLMLHASGLEIAGLALRSEAPPEMVAWLERGDLLDWSDAADVERRVEWARTKRYALAEERATNGFRVIHEDGDALPGVAVDRWDEWLTLQIHEGSGADMGTMLRALEIFGARGVYTKVRPRGPAPSDTSALAPKLPARGEPAPSPLAVLEEGAELFVRLDDGLATGLYLDQRQNRARVRAASADKRVLNLFAYTCAFTVAAARGGARASVSVDASMTALERGRENLLRAGAEPRAHELVMDDAARFLARAARKGERFDLVILDPPSFGRAKGRRFSSGSDYLALARASLEVLDAGGALLACTNHRALTQNALRRTLHEAAREAKRTVAQMKDLAPGPDFPVALGGEPTMKSVWLRLV